MLKSQTTTPQTLARGHSFINRTPHAVLMVTHKDTWEQVLSVINKSINCNHFRSNQTSKDLMPNLKNNKNAFKCLKIQQCQFQSKYNNNNKKRVDTLYYIPLTINHNLFQNITKLVIIKCKLSSICFCIEQSNTKKSGPLFPNLEQFDGSSNNFTEIPKFLYQCSKINRLYLEKNRIKEIPNQLTALQNLKLLRIFGNYLTQIGKHFYNSVRNKDKTLEFEWAFIFQQKQHLQSPQSIPSMHTTGSIMSELDNSSQQIFTALTQRNGDISLKQLIREVIKITDMKIVDAQIQSLVFDQHIFYLSFVQQFITKYKCKELIEVCFQSRKYQSLSFLISLHQKLENQDIINSKRILSSRQNRIVPSFSFSKIVSSLSFKKQSDQEKENQNLVGHKKIKMLTIKTNKQKQQFSENATKSTTIKQSNKNKARQDPLKISLKSTSTQKMSNYFNFRLASPKYKWNDEEITQQYSEINTKQGFISTRDTQFQNILQNQLMKENKLKKNQKDEFIDDNFLLHKLVTYEEKLIQQISKKMMNQINADQFIWLLNQLQFSSQIKSQCDIKLVFSSMQLNQIVNNIIVSQNSLQNVFNSIIYKKAIKLIIMYSRIKFLDQYCFDSCSVLKNILSLDDFQLFHYMQKKYQKFIQALFKNIPNFSLMQTGQSNTPEINNVNLIKSVRGQIFQGVSWKFLTNPKSKIYKYIYKKYKIYIKNQLQTNSLKNWHFPEYVLPQSMIIRNDVHDYQVLKDYQQFQASFNHKDLRLHVKQTNRQNSYSIAKKIYMEVLDQAKSSVRNLGKTKQKEKQKQSDTLNHSLIERENRLIRKQQILKKIKSQMPSPQKTVYNGKIIRKLEEGLFSNQKFQKTYDISKRNSIKLISNQKMISCGYRSINKEKKKNGISVCSSSFSSIKHPNNIEINKKQKTQRKTIYIDLSKNSNAASIKKGLRDQSISPYQGLYSCTSDRKQYFFINQQNQIQCSTFDQTF